MNKRFFSRYKIRNSRRNSNFLLILIAFATSHTNLQAENNNEENADDENIIIITANKRAEPLQDVPLSVSAISSLKIEREGIRVFSDYGVQVPNLSFSQSNSSSAANSLSISLRGVNGGNTTGFYIDESPLSEGLNPRVVDLERIEVIRGPQGTLYGARSLGGTIRLITKKPDPSAARVEGDIRAAVETIKNGEQSYLLDTSFNIPVSQDVAFRVLAYKQSIGGFIDISPDTRAVLSGEPDQPLLSNTLKDTNSEDVQGIQLSGLFELMDDKLTVIPRFMYEKTDFDGRNQVDVTSNNGIKNRNSLRFFDLPEETANKWTLGTLTATYDAEYGQFTSATSLFNRKSNDAEDASIADFAGLLSGIPNQPLLPILQFLDPAFPAFPDGALSPAIIKLNAKSDNITQEFRFVSNWDSKLQLTTGLFYSDSKGSGGFPSTPLPPIPVEFLDLFNQSTKSDTEEIAIFGEATYSFNERARVILGGRYFENKITVESFQGGTFGSGLTINKKQSETGFNPHVGIQYDLDDDQMLYATSSEGYRVGGPNIFPLSVCEASITNIGLDPSKLDSFKSDSLTSYELGYKSNLLGGKLQLNSAAYRIDWKDIQQSVGFQCGFGATVNAGAARINGSELEVKYSLNENSRLSIAGGYTDAKITDNGSLNVFLTEGSRIQDVPKWTLNTSLDSHFSINDVEFFSYLSYSYVGSSTGRAQLGVDHGRSSYSLVNFRIGADLLDSTISFYIKNLTDETADFGNKPPLALDTPGLKRTTINYPRTIGLEIRHSF